jgi:hypothetical protein
MAHDFSSCAPDTGADASKETDTASTTPAHAVRQAVEGCTVIDAVPTLVWIARSDGTAEFFNRRWLDYTGLTEDDALGGAWASTIHAEDLKPLLDSWNATLAAGVDTWEVEARMRRFDGEYRWFLVRAMALHDDSGSILRWYGTNVDIEERRRAEQALSASERSLRTIVDSLPGLVYTMTPECGLEMVNRQVLEYFGCSLEELKDWDQIGCVHPDDLPSVHESLGRTVELGEPHEVEQRLRRADGVYRWFKPLAHALRDEDGRIVRWYCLLIDVDDLKHAEKSLHATQAQLVRATHLATVSELSASIAHEMNQPLAAVVAHGHACRQWLSADPPNVDRALMSADHIVRDGKSASEVVERMRSLFRHAPLDMALLDFEEVIDETCSLVSGDLRARRIALERVCETPLNALADRVQVQQVLINLLRNGIESMDGVADRPKRLAVAARHEGNEVVVEVTDHGIGISDFNAPFETFYTTKPKGMGLGLAICRSIIDAHGGRLWAARNEPYGATFGFALPSAADGTQ